MAIIGGYFAHVFLALILRIQTTAAIQCYSCRGSGLNEIDANIRCLENTYLEDCDDFYQYYDEVEDQDVLSYEYYYYEPEEVTPRAKSGSGKARGKSRGRTSSRDTGHARGKRQTDREVRQRVDKANLIERETPSPSANRSKHNDDLGEYEDGYYDEYDEYYDYNFTDSQGDAASTTLASVEEEVTTTKAEAATTKKAKPKLTLPKDPEHHCYSTTLKTEWESYEVEKGCKKISYCKNLKENKPQWSQPWNFCCDRPRCNAKLVIDKPQRIFGMGCRRTDDCIQGNNIRDICPNFFKTCPRITRGMIKMECRSKSGPKTGAFAYRSRDKKCYCDRGYIPKGPICTSGNPRMMTTSGRNIAAIVSSILMLCVAT